MYLNIVKSVKGVKGTFFKSELFSTSIFKMNEMINKKFKSLLESTKDRMKELEEEWSNFNSKKRANITDKDHQISKLRMELAK